MEYSSNKQEKLRELDRQEKELLLRSKKYGVAELNINMESKRALIDTLKSILAKKYALDENEYIILIDRFKLDGRQITKDTIEELVSYLNNGLRFTMNDSLIGGSAPPHTVNTERAQPSEYPADNVMILPKRPKRLHMIHDLLVDLDIMNFDGTYTINLAHSRADKPNRLSIGDIHISPGLISKYKLDSFPFILVKIQEFNNSIFINTSRKYYYTYFTVVGDRVVLEKNHYIPDSAFNFKKITMTLYTHQEDILKILDFQESSDFIKVVLVAKFK